MRRFLLSSPLLVLLAIPTNARATSMFASPAIHVPLRQAMTTVNLSSSAFAHASQATVNGTISASVSRASPATSETL
jgi:hypothetical protein